MNYKPTIAQAVFGCAPQELKADWASDALYELSEKLGKMNPDDQAHGFLGGEYGYGQEFENNLFIMRPYYWGDCDCGYEDVGYYDGKHKNCYQNHYKEIYPEHYYLHSKIEQKKVDVAVKKLCKEMGLTYPAGSAVHCTCDYHKRVEEWHKQVGFPMGHKETCATVLPNFHHKPTGLKVSWYKYIGRGMSANQEKPENWHKLIAECIESPTP